MSEHDRLLDLDPRFAPVRATAAGLLAGLAYLGVMYADMAVTRSHSDDLLMIGRPLTADPRRARLLGLLAHGGFSAFIGLLYGGVVRRRLPGSDAARGVTMMLAENTLLWPLALLADRYDPAIRSGELPKLNSPVPFAQQIVRHIGFGYVLGRVYGKGRE